MTDPILKKKITEEAQIKKAKKKPEAFAPLYEKYHEPIFRFIYSRMNSEAAAADLTSQTFLKALLHIPYYQAKGLPFSSWLYRIAINEMNQFFRKNQKQRTINIETASLKEMMEELKTDDRLSPKVDWMIEALDELDEADLQLIEMKHFEKRSFKEIAEILGIKENNAKVRAHRILKSMKISIEQKMQAK